MTIIKEKAAQVESSSQYVSLPLKGYNSVSCEIVLLTFSHKQNNLVKQVELKEKIWINYCTRMETKGIMRSLV